MSCITVMKALPSLWILAVLFPADSAHQGLLCTNDYVNNVSCSSWAGSGCVISGVKKFFKLQIQNFELIIRSCTMTQHSNSPPSCSFVFEGTHISGSEKMPNISMTCNGALVTNITDYIPANHIKMHPPGTPRVNITVNHTQISWSPGEPVSYLLKSELGYQVQVKRNIQSWAETKSNFTTQQQEMRIPVSELSGPLQARVRVKPINRKSSHWSDWSPTTSWVVAADKLDASNKQDWWLDQTPLLVTGIFLTLGLLVVVGVAFYKSCKIRKLKGRPVPNPSKYLENIHSGNLKNRLSESEVVFVPPCDQISPVEVCEDWEVMVPSPSLSSSSTSALLHFQNYPPSASYSSGIVYTSSSLSSYSNMGYFSSADSSRTDPHPAYFTYNDPFLTPPTGPQPQLCDTFSSGPVYESLKREPDSPDSGFGIMEETEEDLKEHTSPFLILSLHLPSYTCPPSSPPPPPPPPPPPLPAVAQVFSTRQDLDVSESGDGGSSAAQLAAAAAAMCRPSSMPVESFKSDYLTLKELQTTFSNKSI